MQKIKIYERRNEINYESGIKMRMNKKKTHFNFGMNIRTNSLLCQLSSALRKHSRIMCISVCVCILNTYVLIVFHKCSENIIKFNPFEVLFTVACML